MFLIRESRNIPPSAGGRRAFIIGIRADISLKWSTDRLTTIDAPCAIGLARRKTGAHGRPCPRSPEGLWGIGRSDFAEGEIRGDGANDGTRTHDHSDHNRALYQLSYVRHIIGRRTMPRRERRDVYDKTPRPVKRGIYAKWRKKGCPKVRQQKYKKRAFADPSKRGKIIGTQAFYPLTQLARGMLKGGTASIRARLGSKKEHRGS